MFRANNSIEKMFASQKGNELYNKIIAKVEKENMTSLIDGGVLIGLSGGADSVFLLCFLIEYRKRCNKDFSILAVHINHGIRGEEANNDETFSKEICREMKIDFESCFVDVPTISKNLGIGIEEAARNARYSIFDDLIESRNDISTIAIAHNATDNAETVIMNILRGSGLSGVCGIKPIRDNIIRPIISITKGEIISSLEENQIPFVTDSTNLSSDYTRNYIRNEIMPLLFRLSDSPEASFTRLTENLRIDLDYLSGIARSFIENECNDKIYSSKINELHPSVGSKVISMLVHKHTGEYPEEKHISALRELIKNDNFTYSLPGEMNFVCQRGICFFTSKKEKDNLHGQIFSLSKGENKISGSNLTVYVGEFDKSSLNVYNFSIQAKLSSAIINDGLTLRFKTDGDSYKYSGMTHKLKKVFNDRNIPPVERALIPLLCDSHGIVFVPGLSERDGAKSNNPTDNVTVTFAYGQPTEDETEIFTALLRK